MDVDEDAYRAQMPCTGDHSCCRWPQTDEKGEAQNKSHCVVCRIDHHVRSLCTESRRVSGMDFLHVIRFGFLRMKIAEKH